MRAVTPIPLHATPSGYRYGFWAIGRPMTKTWGSGNVWTRLCASFGAPDVAFGKTDGIPDSILSIDQKTGHEWESLPFETDRFAFADKELV